MKTLKTYAFDWPGLALLIAAILATSSFGIWFAGYRLINKFPIRVEGGSILSYDPVLGFVALPNSATKRFDRPDHPENGGYDLYADRLSARVSAAGEQTPDKVDVLFIGDSVTYGAGVQNAQTYANIVPRLLGAVGVNLAFPSYGTTLSLLMLRRNLNLRPRLVVYSILTDHLRRNVLPCADFYYTFCMDQAYVTTGPKIHPPWTNGVRRLKTQIMYETRGLDPFTWFVHGIDVVIGRVLFGYSLQYSVQYALHKTEDTKAREIGLDYLLGEMATAAKSINAKLIVVFIPILGETSTPAAITKVVQGRRGIDFLDLTKLFQQQGRAVTEMYIPNDGHLSVMGHALVADAIADHVR